MIRAFSVSFTLWADKRAENRERSTFIVLVSENTYPMSLVDLEAVFPLMRAFSDIFSEH